MSRSCLVTLGGASPESKDRNTGVTASSAAGLGEAWEGGQRQGWVEDGDLSVTKSL